MDRVRSAGWIATAIGLMAFLPASAGADESPKPLARYVPAGKLIAYFEYDGLKAHEASWKKTALWKALHETRLGELVEDLARQGLDAAAKNNARFRDARGVFKVLLSHLRDEGFAAAAFGDGRSPHFVLVARGVNRPDVRKRLREAGVPIEFPAADLLFERDGRSVYKDGRTAAWWAEKEDVVFADQGGLDQVLAALDGKAPNALDHPVRAAVGRAEDGFEPVVSGFVDVTALPPLPPDAQKVGIDGIRRIELRWGFQGEALTTIARIVAPRPRRGFVALLDQPGFSVDSLPPIPEGLGSFTALSLELLGSYDRFAALARENDPQTTRGLEQFEARVREQLGLDLRDDLLKVLGPQAAFYLLPAQLQDAGALPPQVAGLMAFSGTVFVAQAGDREATAPRLDKVVQAANRALAAQAGRLPRPLRFAKVDGPEVQYVMDLSGLGLPPFFEQNFSPTIALSDGWLVVAGTRPGAMHALRACSRPERRWKPTEAFVPMAERLPAGMFLLSVADVRDTLPTLIQALPQFAAVFNQQVAREMGPNGFTIDVDPAKVPPAEQLRPLLFPNSFAVSADDEAVTYRQRESIPSVASPASSGTLAALLLPAVQSAREAARRSYCANNLRSVGIAVHNYHTTFGKFPGDIVDKDGKPLLSWRVAILPYLENAPLFEKFKLDEPWDSPHNKPLLAEMPSFYLCPSHGPVDETRTTYQGFAGPHAMLEPGRRIEMQDVHDGTTYTAFAVEGAADVPWTKPADLPFDPDAPPPRTPFGAGSKHAGGFNALFADGSVRFIKLSIATATLRGLITIDQNEFIGPDSF